MSWYTWIGIGALFFGLGYVSTAYTKMRANEKKRNEAIRNEIKKAREAVDGAERAVLIASLRRGSDSADSSK